MAGSCTTGLCAPKQPHGAPQIGRLQILAYMPGWWHVGVAGPPYTSFVLVPLTNPSCT